MSGSSIGFGFLLQIPQQVEQVECQVSRVWVVGRVQNRLGDAYSLAPDVGEFVDGHGDTSRLVAGLLQCVARTRKVSRYKAPGGDRLFCGSVVLESSAFFADFVYPLPYASRVVFFVPVGPMLYPSITTLIHTLGVGKFLV